MNKRSFSLALLALTSLSAGAAEPNVAIESAKQINTGNQLLRDGHIDQALAQYEQVIPAEGDRDKLRYNQAVALYRKGEADAAAALFAEAAGSLDAHISAASKYNLGNCSYTQGIAQAEKDKSAAISTLEQAISFYRASLRTEPNNADARANIELAAQLIDQLKQQQKQEDQQKQDQEKQDQQQQDQQQDQSSDEPQQDKQSQEQDSKQNGSEKQDSEEDKSPQQNQEKDEQQQKPEQQSQAEQDQADQNKSQPEQAPQAQSQQDSEQQPTRQPRDSTDSQSSDSQQPDQGQPEPEQQVDQASVPTGDLKAAYEKPTDQKPNFGIADPNAKPGQMNKEEALKMLQAVRDRDMLRRLRQEQIERSRQVHVDRDW